MKKLMSIFALLMVLILPTNAFALSCEPPNVVKAYDRSDSVIAGVVREVTEKKDHKELKVEVLYNYKGVEEKEISVREDFFWGESKLNETYLFFLNKKDRYYEHPLCSSTTTNLEQANKFPTSSTTITGGTGEASEPVEVIPSVNTPVEPNEDNPAEEGIVVQEEIDDTKDKDTGLSSLIYPVIIIIVALLFAIIVIKRRIDKRDL